MAATSTAPPSVLDTPSSAPSASSSTHTHIPEPGDIPGDFKSSLVAWWSSNGYRDARLAEERLLRKMPFYTPSLRPESKSWFWNNASSASLPNETEDTPEQGTGLVARVRKVFVPTPDPHAAPPRPDVPAASDVESISSGGSSKAAKRLSRVLHHDKERKGDYINTLEFTTPQTTGSREAVVVLHGYGAAQGFFFKNWASVSRSAAATGRRTFFLDWLGMGLSSRPSSHLLSSKQHSVESRVATAEHFFLDSLENWRRQEGIDKMLLVGHSLGGYLSTAYAKRHPDRVSALVLLSPVGFPHNPDGSTRPLPAGADGRKVDGIVAGSNDQAEAAVHKELGADQANLQRTTSAGPATEATDRDEHIKGEARQWRNDSPSTYRKIATRSILWAWERGLSPFSLMRSLGPWGPLLVGKYTMRRFSAQDPDDIRALHAYIYGVTAMRGSGEYCISHLLAPGAYARMPLVERIAGLSVPVTFAYGDNDWMDVKGGNDAQERLREAGNADVHVKVVSGAGHHLYLDNPEETNQLIDEAIRAVPNRG
ncbi:hypothetical protein A1Q2_04675 [Trichosporon asahii var. asahii CBS 8904]|uniref:AB hydrolase-1 domain-containing protein n=1 Tax=Trichosporon asahii var. asahii (strain CBS 8904) TaxID=1220162 RepID=K1VVV5_TRIAC|nr:hypothetical protein A1Q2_04675 [Trichosporon asahii var. asahii CBS 8904]